MTPKQADSIIHLPDNSPTTATSHLAIVWQNTFTFFLQNVFKKKVKSVDLFKFHVLMLKFHEFRVPGPV